MPARADSDADSHVRSDVDDDQEEVQRPQGSDDDEGEDLLEGAEGCMPLCRLESHAPSYQDDAASSACYAPTPYKLARLGRLTSTCTTMTAGRRRDVAADQRAASAQGLPADAAP